MRLPKKRETRPKQVVGRYQRPRLAAVDPTGIAAIVGGYLLGGVDFGVIVPRIVGVDIYAVGSGNPGAANVVRSLGRTAGGAVLLGDLSKGLLASMAGDLLASDAYGFAAGFAAVAGHCYPLWHRFRGGKGVATGGGVVWWMEPILGLIMLAAYVTVSGVTKRASAASVTLTALFVPGLVVFGHRGWSLVWTVAIGLLILFRHRANIVRLVTGREHTIEGPVS